MKYSTVLNYVEELLSETHLVVSTSEKIYEKKKKKNSGSLDTKAVERDEWKEGKECALLSRWCNFFLKCCILPVCHYCYSRCNMADLGTLPVLVKLFTTSEN